MMMMILVDNINTNIMLLYRMLLLETHKALLPCNRHHWIPHTPHWPCTYGCWKVTINIIILIIGTPINTILIICHYFPHYLDHPQTPHWACTYDCWKVIIIYNVLIIIPSFVTILLIVLTGTIGYLILLIGQ